VASLGVPVYSVSPKINAKNGVNAAGAEAKLIVDPDIEKFTPGLNGTPLSTTNMANAVGGLNGTPLMLMSNVCCTPSKVRLSILRY